MGGRTGDRLPTIETVCRTITQLVQSGVIALESSRRIAFRNPGALQRLNA